MECYQQKQKKINQTTCLILDETGALQIKEYLKRNNLESAKGVFGFKALNVAICTETFRNNNS